jgi:hypothetical protein
MVLLGMWLVTPAGLAAQDAASGAASHVQGTVLLGASNQPLSGAKVVLFGDTALSSRTTGQNGRFDFDNVQPPGIYFLEVTYFGLHAQQNVTVNAGGVIEVSIRLDAPEPGRSVEP